LKTTKTFFLFFWLLPTVVNISTASVWEGNETVAELLDVGRRLVFFFVSFTTGNCRLVVKWPLVCVLKASHHHHHQPKEETKQLLRHLIKKQIRSISLLVLQPNNNMDDD
jgi:hypothetical protein